MRFNATRWTALTMVGLAGGIAAGASIGALATALIPLTIGGILGAAQSVVLRAERAAGVQYASALGRLTFLALSGATFGALTGLPLRRLA